LENLVAPNRAFYIQTLQDNLEAFCKDCPTNFDFNQFLAYLSDDDLLRLSQPSNNVPTNNLGLKIDTTHFTSTKMDALAYEFSVTGKPNPNYAVYANGVELDWYRVDSQGNVILMDAKNYDSTKNPLVPQLSSNGSQIVYHPLYHIFKADFIVDTTRQLNAIPTGSSIEIIVPTQIVANAMIHVIRTDTTLQAAYGIRLFIRVAS
jgi:hypothetical protein